MAEIVIAIKAVSLLGQAFQTSEEVLRLRDQRHNVRQLELDVRASLQKFQVWQKTWPTDERHPEISAKALWGVQGWTHLHQMLKVIIDTSQELVKSLQALKSKADGESKPRARWKRAYRAFQTKREPSAKMQELQELSATLTKTVDELWIYSETVFDSLHGVLSHDPTASGRGKLLDTALGSRPCSLDLYSRCSVSTHNYSLKMDLLDHGGARHESLQNVPSGASPSVFYHLVTQSRSGQDSLLQRLTIERVGSPEFLQLAGDNEVVQSTENLQLLKTTASQRNVFIKVAPRGSASDSYIHIPQNHIEPMKLSQSPESLAGILEKQAKANSRSPIGESLTGERLSLGAKIELVFKIVESGFFLLGTPWFASLSSKTLQVLKSTDEKGESYCLKIQTLDLEDILFDDPDALAESSQLFRLGVLLMEIALNQSDLYSKSDEAGQETVRISNLPLVEQIMGAQYCKAMAFCLQYRESGSSKLPCNRRGIKDGQDFRKAEKYDDANFDHWQEYLGELLPQYYSQVYLRIRALRETI